MPIKFRCDFCKQLLGIAHSKAGSLVDCPTCGRTLRVPNLDGTVDPPPAPALNLADDGLRQALDELAQLGNPPPESDLATDEGSAVPPSVPPAGRAAEPLEAAPAPANPVIDVPPNRPVVAANAIALEPLPVMAVVAPPNPQGRPAGAAPPAHSAVAGDDSPEAILAGLASPLATPRALPVAVPRRSTDFPWKWIIAASLLSGLIGLAAGFGLGRATLFSVRPVVSDIAQPAARPADAAGPLAIHGRIRYRNSQGELEPDAGAIVIVLPASNERAVKLKSPGLRPNDDAADRQTAVAELQAAGGQLAQTAADGAYHLDLPQAGDYHVVILSRFHGQTDPEPVTAATESILNEHFERPEQLTGKSNFSVLKITHQGQAPVVLDHEFTD